MALSTRIAARVNQDRGYSSYPSSPVSDWSTVIQAARLNALDDAAAISPDSIADTDRPILTREPWMGNVIETRCVYPAAGSVTAGKFVVAGRNPGGAWTALRNLAGEVVRTITSTTEDLSDGTNKHQLPDATKDRWDCGCFSEFAFVTREALTLSAGDAATAYLQARVITLVAQA